MPRRRALNVFSLSFLDAMTCGLGAVVLLFMVINGAVGKRTQARTADRRAEVNLLQQQVLDGFRNLVEVRNTVEQAEDDTVTARGLASRLLEELVAIEAELATFSKSTTARQEHVNRLQTDLKSLEEAAKRLSAAAPSDETPGDRRRAFIGDGNRQYLTGLKVGGKRIFVLVDTSASMLDDTLVNIIRLRNMDDDVKRRAEKWRQAVATVDWLTTQFPRDASFQIYLFDETARPAVAGSEGRWLDAGNREELDEAMAGLRQVVPGGGTNLFQGLAALRAMSPPADNVILLTDGLPTQGEGAPRGRTVSGDRRLKLFRKAVEPLPRSVPINVILRSMEGDPMAASAWWQVAVASGGSFLSPAGDWP